MRIAFEPNGWMAHVNVCFSRAPRDAEDQPVRDYLAEHELSPRRTLTEEREGEQFEVWQYGECYLAQHLQQLRRLQWQGLISDVLHRALQEPAALGASVVGLEPERVRKIAWDLATMVVEQDAATLNPDGERLDIDMPVVRRELQNLVGAVE